jgi:TPR repeat protein
MHVRHFSASARYGHRASLAVALAGLTVVSGLFAPGALMAQKESAIPQDPSRLVVVDCLLPGQVRKLGGQMTYLSPRRPIKTNASDCEIRGGEYVAYDRANYETALSVWKPQAEAGDAEAQAYVGEIYEKGLGRPADFAEAAKWYEKAAAQNSSRAKMNLAYLYEQGLGVRKDPLKALNLYREASGILDDSLMYVSEAKAQQGELLGQIDALTAQFEQQVGEVDRLKAELDTQETQLSSQRAALTQARSEASGLRADTERLRSAVPTDPTKVAELHRLEAELDAREQKLLREETAVAKREAASAAQRMQLAGQMQAAAEKDLALRDQLEQANTANDQLQQKLITTQRKLLETEQQASKLRADLTGERARIAAEREKLAKMSVPNPAPATTPSAPPFDDAQRKRLEAELVAREKSVAAQQVQIATLQQQQRTYTAELTKLRAEQSAQAETRAQQQAELNATRQQLATTQKQLNDMTAQVDAERARLMADRKQLTAKTSGTSAAEQAARQKLQATLAAREGQIAQQQAQIDELRTQQEKKIAAVRTELVSTKRRLAETEQRTADMTAELAEGRSRLAVEREEINQRVRTMGTAQQEESARLRNDLAARESDLVKQQSLIASLQLESRLYRQKIQDMQAMPMETFAMRGVPAGTAVGGGVSARSVPKELRIGNYHALIIGNNNYQNMPKLQTAAADAIALDQLLRERYGFRTRLLVDATRAEILQAMQDYKEMLKADDNLLIYYAGHGSLDKPNSQSYWLPVNALPDNNLEWIRGQQLTETINLMAARHVLVVADSCYQGFMMRGSTVGFPRVGNEAAQIKRLVSLAKLPSRTVLTSGGEQPVIDSAGGAHSIFAQVMLNVLRENDRVLEGGVLHRALVSDVREAAAKLKRDQSPRYDILAGAGHFNGEFLFIPIT